MRRKILILLVAGLSLSVLSGAGVYFYVGALESQLDASREKLRLTRADLEALAKVVEVPVLKASVARGAKITEADLGTARVALDHMPADLLQDAAEIFAEGKADQVVIADAAMAEGQVLLRSQLLLPDAQHGGTVLVPLGQQAFPLRAANLEDYRDSLKPGDAVDVFWRMIDRKGNRTTRFLVSGMQIAQKRPVEEQGAAAPSAMIASRPESVFLVGSPEQIGLLVQTEGRGELFIAPGGTDGTFPLRTAPVDNQTVERLPLAKEPPASELAAGIGRLASVGGEAEPARPPAALPPNLSDSGISGLLAAEPAPPKCFMTVVKGSTRSVIEVPC